MNDIRAGHRKLFPTFIGQLIVGLLATHAGACESLSHLEAREYRTTRHLTTVDRNGYLGGKTGSVAGATAPVGQDETYALWAEIIQIIDESILLTQVRLEQCEPAGTCGITLEPIASLLERFGGIIEDSRIDPPEDIVSTLQTSASALREADALIRKSSHRNDERMELRQTAFCRLIEARELLRAAVASLEPAD